MLSAFARLVFTALAFRSKRVTEKDGGTVFRSFVYVVVYCSGKSSSQPTSSSCLTFVKENYLQSVFVSKKAPILCFPSDQRSATCTLRHLEVVLQKPRSKQFCEVVSMLVILTMFRSSFTGSVVRYEQFFQSNMSETWCIYRWFGLVWTRSNKMLHQL